MCVIVIPQLLSLQVCDVLRMLQGHTTSLFYWQHDEQIYRLKNGVYVDHLSCTSLSVMLYQFCYAGSCLKLVDMIVDKLETCLRPCPSTLRAFTFSVTEWLRVCVYIYSLHYVKGLLPTSYLVL